MRLDKFLADMQLGTRSQVKEYIKKGLITVNDNQIKKADTKINEYTDKICFHGKQLIYQEYSYYMLYKPAGVVTATKDNHEQTVMDLLPKTLGKNMFPVGRLDKDTEGLLLITNDGELAHNLLSPKKHVAKKYYVECIGNLTQSKIERLQQGVDIGDEELTLPAKVEEIKSTENIFNINLSITEGRFHQVKRMIKAIDAEVTYLKRISMGSLVLDETIGKGGYRELTKEECLYLKSLI